MLRLPSSVIQLMQDDVDCCSQNILRRKRAPRTTSKTRVSHGKLGNSSAVDFPVLRRGPQRSRDDAIQPALFDNSCSSSSPGGATNGTDLAASRQGIEHHHAVPSSYSNLRGTALAHDNSVLARPFASSAVIDFAQTSLTSDEWNTEGSELEDHLGSRPCSAQDGSISTGMDNIQLNDHTSHDSSIISHESDRHRANINSSPLYHVNTLYSVVLDDPGNALSGQQKALDKAPSVLPGQLGYDRCEWYGTTSLRGRKGAHARSWSESARDLISTDERGVRGRSARAQLSSASSPLQDATTQRDYSIQLSHSSASELRHTAFSNVNLADIGQLHSGNQIGSAPNAESFISLDMLHNPISPLEELARETSSYSQTLLSVNSTSSLRVGTPNFRLPGFEGGQLDSSPAAASLDDDQRHTPEQQRDTRGENSPLPPPWSASAIARQNQARPVQRSRGNYGRGSLIWHSDDDLVPEFTVDRQRHRITTAVLLPHRRTQDPEQENRDDIERYLYERRRGRRRQTFAEGGVLNRTPPRESSLDRAFQ